MEIIIGAIFFIIYLGVYLNWGIWIIWSVSILYVYQNVFGFLALFILAFLWLQPLPTPRKILLWVLGVLQLVSIWMSPQFFYIPIVNLFGIYTLYRYSMVRDLQYYFQYSHNISFKDATDQVKQENRNKWIIKTLPMTLINISVFPGLGYLLLLPVRSKLDTEIIKYYKSHNLRESLSLIDRISEIAMEKRWKAAGLYVLIVIVYMVQDGLSDILSFFYIVNPIRGIDWLLGIGYYY